MEQVLLVVQVLIAVALIAMVLIQRSDSDGFGLSGGGGGNLMSGRAAANLMTRTTAILAGLFIVNSLALSVLAAHDRDPSIAEAIESQQTPEGTKLPAVPTAGDQKSEKKTDEKIGEKPVEKAAPKVPVEGESKAVEKKAEEAEMPAEPEKKAKKPTVKPADVTPSEDHNNE